MELELGELFKEKRRSRDKVVQRWRVLCFKFRARVAPLDSGANKATEMRETKKGVLGLV